MKIPRIVASVILKKENKILLVKEVLEDFKEHWIFPGGGVDFGETITEAAKREVKEEIGLDIEIKEFLGFKEAIFPQYKYHTVIFFFIGESSNDKIIKSDKILDAKYFSKEEIKNLKLVQSAEWILEDYIKKVF
ncbi:MAG: NUDIX domain-containing protein [Candidatus Aenigmarchaeota archaeon]|nr:NUDIX domain-containing protein [Candidatus Aenigmarchaeota archaeon]